MEDIFYGIPEKEFAPNDFEGNLRYALDQVRVKGLYMEFGVYNGRSLKIISEFAPKDTKIFGFDSNEGLPEAWHNHSVGTFKGSIPDSDSYTKVIGWFKDTLPKFEKSTVAFMHLDADLYSSTKTVLDNFKGYIVPGTVLVFDEYHGYPTYQDHEYKAFKEFLEETGLKCLPLGVVKSDTNPSPASFIII